MELELHLAGDQINRSTFFKYKRSVQMTNKSKHVKVLETDQKLNKTEKKMKRHDPAQC